MATTKRDAVAVLIRGALRHLREGDQVCALTLAGAAEGAMPDAEDVTAFEVMRSAEMVASGSPETMAARALNAERNWLKHYSAGEVDPMEIKGAAMMLQRAVSRYAAVYGPDDLILEESFRALVLYPGYLPLDRARSAGHLADLLDQVAHALRDDRHPMPDELADRIHREAGAALADRTFASGARAVRVYAVRWRSQFVTHFAPGDR